MLERIQEIDDLAEKDKSVIFRLIETMLTKKKFKDFFQENVATLLSTINSKVSF